MPVWQFDSVAKTATRWRYSPLGSHVPICSEVWAGVECQEAAVARLRKQGGPPCRLVVVRHCILRNAVSCKQLCARVPVFLQITIHQAYNSV